MNKGIVTFYNSSKDYGFITDLKTAIEYYIHVTVLEQIIHKNDEVSFELEKRNNRFIAVNVKPILNKVLINNSFNVLNSNNDLN